MHNPGNENWSKKDETKVFITLDYLIIQFDKILIILLYSQKY